MKSEHFLNMGKRRLSRKNVPFNDKQTWKWRRPDIGSWPPDEQSRYQRFEHAITAYLAGEKVTLIEKKYALCISEVQEQLARAMVRNQEGEILGFYALIRSLHIGVQTRKKGLPEGPKPSGPLCKGGLRHLLAVEGLYSEFEDRVLGKRPDIKEAKVSVLSLQKWLAAVLTERGYKENNYPFTTDQCLYSSTSRLVKKIKSENMVAYVHAYGEDRQASNVSVMSGSPVRMSRPFPLEEVEIDEHKLHGIGTVRITIDGIVKRIPAERAVGIAICDRGSNTVLGAAVCLNPEAKADALIEAIRSAVIPHYVVTLPSGKPAPPFRPGDFDPNLSGSVWSVAYLDNARIHTGNQYSEAAARIGSQTCYGPLGSWSGRPNIEGLFSKVVRGKFDRLPSTTGAGRGGRPMTSPAEQAISWDIDLDDLCEVFYQILGEANTQINSGLLNQSPVQVLGDYLRSAYRPLLRRLPLPTASSPEVGTQAFSVSVRQRSKDNPNHYVSYLGAKYSNELLSRRADLRGEKIVIHIGSNLRKVEAFDLRGRSLGTLIADGHWGATDHTREIRLAINRDKHLKFGKHGEKLDPIQGLIVKKAEKAIAKNSSRPRGGVVKGALQLQRFMHATGTEKVILETQSQKVSVSTTTSAAARAREARMVREKMKREPK